VVGVLNRASGQIARQLALFGRRFVCDGECFLRPFGAGAFHSFSPRLTPLRLRSGQAVGCILSPLRGWDDDF
jgi:hypothetical protein